MAISAQDFVKGRPHWFGIDNAAVVRRLRELASAIESGATTVGSVRVLGLAAHDEFTTTCLRLKLFEKLPRAKPETK